ncbi:MAG: hypothetical protein J6T52_10175 [Bacteroidaceae bacterium]|nr:hypothetical protein [Bacteroidaceae bacterium]
MRINKNILKIYSILFIITILFVVILLINGIVNYYAYTDNFKGEELMRIKQYKNVFVITSFEILIALNIFLMYLCLYQLIVNRTILLMVHYITFLLTILCIIFFQYHIIDVGVSFKYEINESIDYLSASANFLEYRKTCLKASSLLLLLFLPVPLYLYIKTPIRDKKVV